jgi:hypothetical protein
MWYSGITMQDQSREHKPILNPAPSEMHPAHGAMNTPHKPLMTKMNQKKNKWMAPVLSLLVVLAGVGTGWFLSGGANAKTNTSANISSEQKDAVTQSDTEAGMEDTSAFEDQAPIGKLIKGGIDGEGQYHLERDGGPTQNVYLTSTVIDLASFEGKKIQVWGNTLSGKKAGWLMDVGKVKVVE